MSFEEPKDNGLEDIPEYGHPLDVVRFWEQYGPTSGYEYTELQIMWQAAKDSYGALPYHNFRHAKEVLWASMELAAVCEANNQPLNRRILVAASLFHDSQYHLSTGEHASKEAHSVAYMREQARNIALTESEIAATGQAIMATKFGVTPKSREDVALVRADMQNVSGNYISSFRAKTNMLWEEALLLNEGASPPNHVEFIRTSIHVISTYLSNDLSLGEFDDFSWLRRARLNLEQLAVEYALLQGITATRFLQNIGSTPVNMFFRLQPFKKTRPED